MSESTDNKKQKPDSEKEGIQNDEEQPEEQKDDASKEEVAASKSWLPDTTWAASLVHTAKEKTKSTIETMKKDIHEFSDTIQHGANNLANATAKQAQIIQQMIAPTPDPRDDMTDTKLTTDSKEEEAKTPTSSLSIETAVNANSDSGKGSSNDADGGNKSSNGLGGLFGMGWMKQVVETVHKFATEDTTKDEEECTEAIHVGPGGRKTILDQFTLLQMQNDARTFLQPPQQNIDFYKEWLVDFKISEYNGEINILLGYNPRLREIYAELVPSEVDNYSFWNRYFFKVHLKELDKQIALGLTGEPKVNNDKIGSASNGHSPAPSNGGKDDWSMCSSGMTTEAEEMEKGESPVAGRDDASTPKPQLGADLQEDMPDDWEECEDPVTEEEGGERNASGAKPVEEKAK